MKNNSANTTDLLTNENFLSRSTVKQIEYLPETSTKLSQENTDQCTLPDLNVTFTEDNDNALDNMEDSENDMSINSDDDDDDDDGNKLNKGDVSSFANQPNQSVRLSRKSIYKNSETEKPVDHSINFIENIHRHDQVTESSSESSNICSGDDDNLDLDRYLVDNDAFPNSTQDISVGTEAKLLEEDLSSERSTTKRISLHKSRSLQDDDLLNSPERDDGGDTVSNCIEGLFITPKNDDVHSKEDLKTPVTSISASRKTRRSCRNDLTNVLGVKELMKTPKNLKDPPLLGVKELLKTPKSSSISATRLVGVKELMRTPKSDVDNFDNVKGVRELLNTPARDDISDVKGVKELMKTPVLRTPKLHI